MSWNVNISFDQLVYPFHKVLEMLNGLTYNIGPMHFTAFQFCIALLGIDIVVTLAIRQAIDEMAE